MNFLITAACALQSFSRMSRLKTRLNSWKARLILGAGLFAAGAWGVSYSPASQERSLAGVMIPGARTPIDTTEASSSPECTRSRRSAGIKHVILVFEGHNGYSGSLGRGFREFQASEPVCLANGSDWVLRYNNGTQASYSDVRNRFHALGVATSDGGSPVGLKFLVLEALCRGGTAALKFSDTEVVYLPENLTPGKALDCAVRQSRIPYTDGDGNERLPSLTLMGFSNGGNAAIMLGHALRQLGIPFEGGFTVDPVPQGVKGYARGEVLRRLGKEVLRAPPGVKWTNFWQESDNRASLKLGIEGFVDPTGLHGHSVAGADINELIVPPGLSDAPDSAWGNGAHWRIFHHPRVQRAILLELMRVRTLR